MSRKFYSQFAESPLTTSFLSLWLWLWSEGDRQPNETCHQVNSCKPPDMNIVGKIIWGAEVEKSRKRLLAEEIARTWAGQTGWLGGLARRAGRQAILEITGVRQSWQLGKQTISSSGGCCFARSPKNVSIRQPRLAHWAWQGWRVRRGWIVRKVALFPSSSLGDANFPRVQVEV